MLRSRRAPRRRPSGFTLIEVVLALALTAILMGLLAMVISVHLRVVDSGRADVEQAQLARAILYRIADDLRGAVCYQPVDLTKMVPDVGSSGGGSGSSVGGSGGGTGGGPPTGGVGTAGTAGTAGSAGSTASDATAEETATTSLQSIMGLYGSIDRLQVDVSRAPRPDQLLMPFDLSGGAPMADRLSDVKTVAYFVSVEEAVPFASPDAVPQQRGLVRWELDRSATRWAEEQGLLEEMTRQVEPIAPEVQAIEFLYFDGSQWLEYWDSEEQQGLPVAIDIAITLSPPQRAASPWASWQAPADLGLAESGQPVVYRLIVHLPAAQPSATQQSAALESEPEPSEEPGT